MIQIIIQQGAVIPFSSLPPSSIALDGYCQGPALDLETKRFSFDHHDGCIRMFTRATCQQVLDALLLGFQPEGYTVFLNDIDGDTALAVWLLMHPERAREDKVRRLVESVGALDAHGPAYPVQDPALCEAFFQVAMRPEGELRRNGQYGEADLEALLSTCIQNISALLDDTLPSLPKPLPRSYEVFRVQGDKANGWVMVRSQDFVFDLLYEEGFTRAVSFRELPDGSFEYTIGKKSDLVEHFPVGPHSKPGTILYTLSQKEPGWGGGTSIGGAPRNPDGSRSRLPPEEVFRVIEEVLSRDTTRLR